MADHKKPGPGDGPKKRHTRPPGRPGGRPSTAASRGIDASTRGAARSKPATERIRPGAVKVEADPPPPAPDPATRPAGRPPRRRHVRAAARPATALRLRYQALPPDDPMPTTLEDGLAKVGHTDDISMGGAFVLSKALPPIGARIAVELDLASTWQPLVVLAEVRWHKKDPSGFGVAFVDLTTQAHVALGQLLTTLSFND